MGLFDFLFGEKIPEGKIKCVYCGSIIDEEEAESTIHGDACRECARTDYDEI